jgi:alpha-1,6-mannosyltransferase
MRPFKSAFCFLLSIFASLLVYTLWLLQPFPLLSFYSAPLLDLGKITNNEASAALSFTLGMALSFVCYLCGYRLAAQLPHARYLWVSIAATLLYACILVFAHPIGANDVYDYAFRGRLWGHYNFNPLTTAALQASADAWFPYLVWIWHGSPYGPLWAMASLWLYHLAGASLLLNLIAHKALMGVCIVVTTFIVYDLLRERGIGVALSGVVLFAWNPLLLFEGVVNAHNDALMMTFIVLALWLQRRQRITSALVCVTLATLIKITAAVWWPLLLLSGLRESIVFTAETPRRKVFFLLFSHGFRASVVCLLLVVLLYAPFWDGANTFAGLVPLNDRFTSSLAAIIKLSLQLFVGEPTAMTWTRTAMSALFLPLYAYLLWRTFTNCHAERSEESPSRKVEILRSTQHDAQLHQRMFQVCALVLLLPTLWFQPWYVTWLIALAPLVDEAGRRLAIVWSIGAFAMYIIFNFLWYWQPLFFNAGEGVVINLVAWLAWVAPVGSGVLWQKRKR